jgi:hypothetical protein
MEGFKLQPWQAEKINAALFPLANHLIRLRERMDKVSFLGTDPIYQATVKAQQAIQDLTVHLHYASCTSGVGAPERFGP